MQKTKGVKMTKKEFFNGLVLFSLVIIVFGSGFSFVAGYFSNNFWKVFWSFDFFFLGSLIFLLLVGYFYFYKTLLVPSGTISDSEKNKP